MSYEIGIDRNRAAGAYKNAPKAAKSSAADKEEGAVHAEDKREIQDKIEFSVEAREYVSQAAENVENIENDEEREYYLTALSDKVMSLGASREDSEEQAEKLKNALQAGLAGIAEQVKAGKQEFKADPRWTVDPDGSIYRREYFTAYIGKLQETVQHIESYYADAKAENSKLGTSEFLMRMREKYINEDSPIFKGGLSASERETAMYQEKALYFGTGVTLKDPRALADCGGIIDQIELDKSSRQAAEDYIARLISEQGL